MERRTILTALFSAPLAALSSAVQGMGLRRRGRRCCEQEVVKECRLEAIEDVDWTAMPTGGGMYTVTLTGTVAYPDDGANDVGPIYRKLSVYGKLVEVATNTVKVTLREMLCSSPTVPQGEGVYRIAASQITLRPGYEYKVTVRTLTELTEFSSYTKTL